MLGYSAAHAAARDAVWAALDLDRLVAEIAPAGLPSVRVRTQAGDRATYLQRPDLGRRLHPADEPALVAARPADGCDLALVVGDGLSATAAQHDTPGLVSALSSCTAP